MAIDSIADMETLLDQIPLDRVSISMTINAPASILLALLLVVAERRSIAWEKLNGTIQNSGTMDVSGANPFNLGSSALLEVNTTQGELDLIDDVSIPVTTGTIRVDSGAYAESSTVTTGSGAHIGAFLDLNGGNLIVNSTPPLYLEGGGQGAAASYIQIATVFFAGKPVRNYQDAKAANTKRYARYFREMLDRGIFLAPSQFEAAFVSAAHSEADIDRALEAARQCLHLVANDAS